jgi:hypothetical protein
MESGRFLLASIAVFDVPVCTTPLKAAGGRDTLLKLQTGFKKKSGRLVPLDSCRIDTQNGTD